MQTQSALRLRSTAVLNNDLDPSAADGTSDAKVPRTVAITIWLLMALSCLVKFEPAPYDIMIMGISLVVLVSSIRHKLLIPDVPKVALWLYFSCVVISIIFADDVLRALEFSLVTMYLMLSWMVFIATINRFGEKILDIVYSGYTAAALFSATVGTLAFLNLIPYYDTFTKYGRATALFKDPNVYGPFLIPVAIYAMMQMTKKGFLKRTFWISTLAIVSTGILVSFSRASWGNYVLTTFLYLIVTSKGNLKKLGALFLIVALAASALLVVVATNPQISNMLEARFKLQGYDNDRFSTHEAAIKASLNNPLGIGPGQSESYFNYATHNVYLRVLTENGFLGFLGCFGFLFLTLIQAAIRSFKTRGELSNHYALALAALTGILLNSFVIDSLHWRHMWFLAAIPWISAKIAEKNKLKGLSASEQMQTGYQERSLVALDAG
jgi:O-antigen ligase